MGWQRQPHSTIDSIDRRWLMCGMVRPTSTACHRMFDYERILLAVDLTDECRRVADRARMLAAASTAELHIVHVLEPLTLAYGDEVPMNLCAVQEQIEQRARQHLDAFAAESGVPPACRHLVFGRPESEIHRLAEDERMDLIVVGSHGRHGLALLLGSTANGVLHGASCDVLAVRVGLATNAEGD